MTQSNLAARSASSSDNAARYGLSNVGLNGEHDAPSTGVSIAGLLRRMRSGDREAAATFITSYGSRVRRRVRGKLGPAMRRLFDSEEILSTVGRRLDMYVRRGRLEATGESQLWTLIFKIADLAVLQKTHVFQRLQEVEGVDSEFAQQLLQRLHEAEDKDRDGAEKVIEKSVRLLSNDVDRKVLSLWLAGEPHESIADELGVTATAIRKRWQVIKNRLREHLGVDDG